MLKDVKRVEIVDVLRGFAIMGICIIHMIEHFNFYSFPEVESEWMKFSDKTIWDSIFFTFSGKAYAIFALLFGFSFFVQDNNQAVRGNDFRPRFAWRMILLLGWGTINAMFFTGEILAFYAVMGILVILPVARLSNKTVFVIAILCILQPVEWYKLISALINPDALPGKSLTGYYFGRIFEVQKNGNFIETIKANLVDGQLANWAYAWEYGRIFQTASLFMMGILLGRSGFLLYSENNIIVWRKLLVVAIVSFFPLNGLGNIIPEFITNPTILTPIATILKSLANLAFMIFLVSLVINLYYTTRLSGLLNRLAPYGKMTLTAYITQSIVGSFMFYNWGLGLHDKLSITYSFLIGIAFFLLQCAFATWWMAHHKHGPLEYIWRKLTWIGAKK